MNRVELQQSRCPECGAPNVMPGKIIEIESGRIPSFPVKGWYRHDEERDWGALGYGERWHCDVCDAWLVINPYDPTREVTVRYEDWWEAQALLYSVVESNPKTGDIGLVDRGPFREFLDRVVFIRGRQPTTPAT